MPHVDDYMTIAVSLFVLIAGVIHLLLKNHNRPGYLTASAEDTFTNCKSPECVRCYKYKHVRADANQRFETYCNTLDGNAHSELTRVKNAIMEIEECEHQSELQQPNILYLKGLRSGPVWSERDVFSKVNRILCDRFSDIRNEFVQISRRQSGWIRNETPTGSWFVYSLINQGQYVRENCENVPKTMKLLQKIPNVMEDNLFGNVCFSVIEPGTRIAPHYGPCNIRLRCHLGLICPLACTLTVGQKKLIWDEGKCFFFDDSFLHKAEHSGSRLDDPSRSILLVDLWHPDITAEEKDALNFVFPSSPSSYDDHRKKMS